MKIVNTAFLAILLILSMCLFGKNNEKYFDNNFSVLNKPLANSPLQTRAVQFKVLNRTFAWEIESITYIGPKNGGYNMRVRGTGTRDASSGRLNMGYYTKTGEQVLTGAYIFPAVEKGKPFNLDVVIFLPSGLTPSGLGGLIIKSNIDFPQEQDVSSVENSFTNMKDTQSAEPSQPDYEEIKIIELSELDVHPSFPGGVEGLKAYLAKNLKYPAMDADIGVQGRVIFKFCNFERRETDRYNDIKRRIEIH